MSQHDPSQTSVSISVNEAEAAPSSLSRRELLTRGGALGTAGLLAAAVPAEVLAQDKPDAKPGKPDAVGTKMPLATLGRTGVKVSRLAMGGSWGVDGEVVAVGLEHGINYIDTAESYNGGQSEQSFGEFLKAQGATGHSKARQKLWLVTKTHDHYNLEKRILRSLTRLQQDYVDCFYMHQIQDTKLPANPDIKAAAARMKGKAKSASSAFPVMTGTWRSA